MRKLINAGNILRFVILGLFLASTAQALTLDELIAKANTTLNSVIGLLFILITIYFIWGVIVYVTAGGDDEKLAKGKKHMLWGIIGLAVVGAAWGFAQIVMNYFGLQGGESPTIPQIRNTGNTNQSGTPI